jgi:hypothetical protein
VRRGVLRVAALNVIATISAFKDLMAQIKADIDSQGARVDQIDDTDGFGTLLEQGLARSSH